MVNVTYHPPNTNGTVVTEYLAHTINKIITDFPSATLIIGGDFNRLQLNDIETRFCLTTIDSPPTRGDSCLDLLITNKPHQIESASTFCSTLKSDHLAVILNPCMRIRPHRRKVSFIDYTFKGFQNLNYNLSNFNFSELYLMLETNIAADWLDQTLSSLTSNAFPIRQVVMSDRDPLWMTPKSKWLIQKRKKATHKNDSTTCHKIDTKLQTQKISFLKKDSRKTFWDNVNNVTNRKASNKTISTSSVNGENLNIDLAKRSANSAQRASVKPKDFNPTSQPQSQSPPELSVLEVANAMRKCKRTSPGPTNLPFFIFRIFWDILAPLYLHVWNLSLRSGKFPACYKRANLTPIPKVNNASTADDIRGISVTSISARLFEKLVHKKWILPNIVRLGDPLQFAYRPRLSTADCLLTMQHHILSLLDKPNIDGVYVVIYSRLLKSLRPFRSRHS